MKIGSLGFRGGNVPIGALRKAATELFGTRNQRAQLHLNQSYQLAQGQGIKSGFAYEGKWRINLSTGERTKLTKTELKERTKLITQIKKALETNDMDTYFKLMAKGGYLK